MPSSDYLKKNMLLSFVLLASCKTTVVVMVMLLCWYRNFLLWLLKCLKGILKAMKAHFGSCLITLWIVISSIQLLYILQFCFKNSIVVQLYIISWCTIVHQGMSLSLLRQNWWKSCSFLDIQVIYMTPIQLFLYVFNLLSTGSVVLTLVTLLHPLLKSFRLISGLNLEVLKKL